MKGLILLLSRYITNQKKRKFLIIVGISISVCLLASIGIIFESLRVSKIDQTRKVAGFYHIGLKNITKNQISYFHKTDGIEKVGVSKSLGIAYVGNNDTKVILEEQNSDLRDIIYMNLIKGNYPQNENELAIEEWILEELNLKPELGQKIILKIKDLHDNISEKEFVLSGIIGSFYSSKLSNIGRALTYETPTNTYQQETYNVFLKISDKYSNEKLLYDLIIKIKKDLSLREGEIGLNNRLLEQSNNSMIPSFEVLFIILIVVITCGAFIYNIMNISVLERIRHIGILKAIGIKSKQVILLLVLEGVLLSLVSIPAGFIGAIVITKSFSYLISSLLSTEITTIIVTPQMFFIVAAIVILTVLISSFPAVFIGSKVTPLEALKTCGIKSSTLNPHYTGIKLLLNKFISRSIILKVSYQNIWRNKKRTMVSVASMSLGVIIFIMFSYLVTSIDIGNSLERRFFGEYRLLTNEDNSIKDFSKEDLLSIQNCEGVKQVLGTQISGNVHTVFLPELYNNSTGFIDKKSGNYMVPGEVFGYSEDALKMMKNIDNSTKESLNTDFSAFVMISDVLKKSLNLKIGDQITVSTYRVVNNKKIFNESKNLVISGFINEIPLSREGVVVGVNIIVNQDVYRNIFNDETFQRIDVIVDKGVDLTDLDKFLKNMEDKYKVSVLSLHKETAKLAQSKNQMMVLLYCLIAVIVFISILNIFNATKASMISRSNEFGMLRAVGMTVVQLRNMILIEGILYGAYSGIFGCIFGILFSWGIYWFGRNSIDLNGWCIQWQYITLSFIGCIGVGVISVLIPLKNIVSINIIDSIRSID